MKRKSIVLIGLLAMALQGSVAAQQNLPPEVVNYADQIVINANIISGDERFSRYQAMAVRDGKVLALGTTAQISRMAGPDTERIDLQGTGTSIIPGLFESHGHGPMGTGGGLEQGLDAKRGNVEFETIEGGLREIAELVEGVPPGRWIVLNGPFGGNAAMNHVTRSQLDTLAPNNPLVVGFAGENSVVNSITWELAGLEGLPGTLKDAEGKPTGQLRTWAHGAMSYAIPWGPLEQEAFESRKRNFFRLNAEGITTVCGRMMGRALTTVRQLWERDELTIRARISLGFLRSNMRPEEYLKRIGKLVSFGLGNMVKIIGLTTQHPDGTMGSGAMLTWQQKLRQMDGDPYTLNGENRWDIGSNDSLAIKLAIKYGWNISGVHNQGDQASWLYLKAIEEGHEQAGVLVPTSLPHGNDHNQLNTEENLALMKKYNVSPSVGMYLGQERLIFQYGGDTAHRTSAFKSMIAAGLRPASEENRPALNAIEKMITRADEEGRVWGSHEILSRQEALWARSLWSAGYCGAEDDRLGSLEPGKLADFVILGGDYLTVPADQISELPVLKTFLGGKLVYDRERDGVPVRGGFQGGS